MRERLVGPLAELGLALAVVLPVSSADERKPSMPVWNVTRPPRLIA
jgi:hypothetical protein